MFKALTAIVALAASASVMAQSDVTLNSLAHDAATRASFNQMVKGHQLPAWVTTGGTGSPAQTVKLVANPAGVKRLQTPRLRP